MNAPIDDLLYGGDDSGDEDMNGKHIDFIQNTIELVT